jgi:diguanylate cyclase (GGDEF)-like protein
MPADFDVHGDLLSFSPFGCLLVDDGVIVSCNDHAVATMGIPRERMISVPLSELLVPDFEPACLDLLKRVDGEPDSEAVRLATGLAPIELMAQKLPDAKVVVAVRSMANEHFYSAQAGGPLTHDLVTGLPDHFHVLSQLHQRLSAPKRLPMAIMCLWVDELSDLIEVHGERAVHRVVKEVGARIQTKLRAPDILGRFEDAGFLVMMTTDSPAEQLTEVAERLRNEVAFPVELDSSLVSFTASVVVGSITKHRPSIERILALLEAAANRAVVSGGNRTDVLAL